MEGKVVMALTVSLLLVVFSKIKSMVAKRALNLPPGPWTLPVIGSVHHMLSDVQRPFRIMQRLAQKHGPVMFLRLGEVPALVVSSPDAAREVMKVHDISFASRPLSRTIGVLTYQGTDLVFAPYGERWRQIRKISVLELLSASRVQSFRRIREEEAARLVQDLATAAAVGGGAVDMSLRISKLVNDTFVREAVGNRCKHQDDYLDALDKAVRLTSCLTLADLFPSSLLMRALGRNPRKALACRDRMQRVLEDVIQERVASVDSCGGEPGHDFLDILLRLQKDGDTRVPITTDTIVSTLFDLFAAGSETSSTTLTWVMTELIRCPRVMEKAQLEVRQALQGKDTITEDDVAGLSYLKIVIKEAMRLHCPLPLLLPRECQETCQFMGYDIPKGTNVFVNVWAICKDPKYWEDPEEFKPERFEDKNIDFKGTNFEFLPFGAGRRMCPGITLGIANIELALASLLYHFDWKLPDGVEAKDIDMLEASGAIARKQTSLYLHPIIHIAPSSI